MRLASGEVVQIASSVACKRLRCTVAIASFRTKLFGNVGLTLDSAGAGESVCVKSK